MSLGSQCFNVLKTNWMHQGECDIKILGRGMTVLCEDQNGAKWL